MNRQSLHKLVGFIKTIMTFNKMLKVICLYGFHIAEKAFDSCTVVRPVNKAILNAFLPLEGQRYAAIGRPVGIRQANHDIAARKHA